MREGEIKKINNTFARWKQWNAEPYCTNTVWSMYARTFNES